MEYVKQTGLLFKFSETDYVAGKNSPLTGIDVNLIADWRAYLPAGEPQYLYATFDTMSCTTFSATNVIETWIKFLIDNDKFTVAQLEKLHTLGIIDDKGNVNFSDRFSAIVSGTTEKGNYFQAVLDSFRKDGLLCEKDLPFSGNSWKEYHDKNIITEEMRNKAKEILKIIQINYEWTPVDDSLALVLKQCPIQGAIPALATHAIMLPKLDFIFDSYPPYLYPRNTIVAYAMKIIVSPVKKSDTILPLRELYKPKNFTLKELVPASILSKFGEKAWEFLDERMLRNLQFFREIFGITNVNTTTEQYKCFDPAVFRKEGTSQHNAGRAVDCIFKNYTSEQVREWLKKPENVAKLPEPNIWVELGTSHFHFDVRFSDKKGVYFFNP